MDLAQDSHKSRRLECSLNCMEAKGTEQSGQLSLCHRLMGCQGALKIYKVCYEGKAKL